MILYPFGTEEEIIQTKTFVSVREQLYIYQRDYNTIYQRFVTPRHLLYEYINHYALINVKYHIIQINSFY